MKNKPVVRVIIYGDNLDPQIITTTLRAEPTASWKKGQKKPSRRPDSTAIGKSSLWTLNSTTQSTELDEHLEELLSILRRAPNFSITSLAGVDDAKIDIYVQAEADEILFQIDISNEQIAEISQLGLRLSCTWSAPIPQT